MRSPPSCAHEVCTARRPVQLGRLNDVAQDLTFRLQSWRCQRMKIQDDPRAVDPRVDSHSRELGFYHCYTAEDGETLAWLRSSAHLVEAKKAHPIAPSRSTIPACTRAR